MMTTSNVPSEDIDEDDDVIDSTDAKDSLVQINESITSEGQARKTIWVGNH